MTYKLSFQKHNLIKSLGISAEKSKEIVQINFHHPHKVNAKTLAC